MTPAGEMWSVVTESPSTASARAPAMSLELADGAAEVLEERRALDVGRLRVPDVGVAGRHRQRLPALVAVEDGA